MPIDYTLTTNSPAFLWMTYHQRCWVCGNPLDETVTELGTMLRCVARAVDAGKREGSSVVYEQRPTCGRQWWVDEDGDEA